MKNSVKKITLTSIFTATALITFTIESLFPPLIIPGAKLGLSNVFILLTLITVGAPYAILALIVKAVLGNMFIGNLSALIYGLPAGLISLTLEILLFYFIKRLSIVSISVLGATINLTVQNVIFCLITGGTEYLVYLPYLALIGVIAGLTVGLTVYFIIKIIPQGILPDISEEKS